MTKKKKVSKTLSIPAKYVIQQYKYHGATCSAKNCTQHYVFLHTQHYVFLHIHADALICEDIQSRIIVTS